MLGDKEPGNHQVDDRAPDHNPPQHGGQAVFITLQSQTTHLRQIIILSNSLLVNQFEPGVGRTVLEEMLLKQPANLAAGLRGQASPVFGPVLVDDCFDVVTQLSLKHQTFGQGIGTYILIERFGDGRFLVYLG
ncbi:MAG: hypothetical protein JWP57_2417 [Spirosoma sp.]|nr:hypothetical protein [Spirosoma sp.]